MKANGNDSSLSAISNLPDSCRTMPLLNVIVTTEAGTNGHVVGALVSQPTITVRDTAVDGPLVAGALVTITVETGTDGSLTGTRTCTTGVDGTCTFTDLAYTKTDSFNLLYTATLYNATTGSTSGAAIQLVADTPDTLTFGRQPANTDGTVDDVLQTQPIINAVDQYGNNCQNDVEITATLNTGTGTLRGTATVAIAGGAGNATFTNLGYSKSGEVFKLEFNPETGDAAAIVSNNITALTPGAKNKVVLTAEPTIGYTYVDFTTQPVVEIQDQYGNKTADTSNVVIAACSGADSETALDTDFSGTKTKAAVAGTATFTGISYDTVRVAGLYLCATSAGITEDCSSLFKIYGNTGGGSGGGTTTSYTSSPTTTVPQTTTTTAPQSVTTTTAPETTTTTTSTNVIPQPEKPIAEMNQAEKNTYTMQLQQFLIQLLTQLLSLLAK